MIFPCKFKNKYSVVPKISYSSNFGLDGSGRHAKTKVDIFNSKLNISKTNFNKKKKYFLVNYTKKELKNFTIKFDKKKSLRFF